MGDSGTCVDMVNMKLEMFIQIFVMYKGICLITLQYSGNCLIGHTKEPQNCVELYRISEYLGFILLADVLLNQKLLSYIYITGCGENLSVILHKFHTNSIIYRVLMFIIGNILYPTLPVAGIPWHVNLSQLVEQLLHKFQNLKKKLLSIGVFFKHFTSGTEISIQTL